LGAWEAKVIAATQTYADFMGLLVNVVVDVDIA